MLINYRRPSKLRFNRDVRHFIPDVDIESKKSPHYDSVKKHHEKSHVHAQTKQTTASKSRFEVGDTVLLKRGKINNKFQSRYYPRIFKIVKKNHSMFTAQEMNHSFKLFKQRKIEHICYRNNQPQHESESKQNDVKERKQHHMRKQKNTNV